MNAVSAQLQVQACHAIVGIAKNSARIAAALEHLVEMLEGMAREDAGEARAEGRCAMRGRGCGDCIHDGCCDGLPSCGGLYWRSKWGECAQCGGRVLLEDCEWRSEDGEHIFCSEKCLREWENDNREEDEDE